MKLKTIYIVFLLAILGPRITPAQKNASLDEQKKCDAQASRVYHEGRARDGYHGEDSTGMNGYTSHFDPATNICYVWVRYGKTDGNTVTFADTISDAFEGRLYASYLWFNPGKKAWEVQPTTCSVKPRKQEEITCKNEEEFDSLVDKYFGIGR
jgi:hypothetical protein